MELGFHALGLVPEAGGGGFQADTFAWDYTTWLNLLFLPLGALLAWLGTAPQRKAQDEDSHASSCASISR